MTQSNTTSNISFITRILLWLSKTDTDLYIKSPENVQFTRKSLGFLVLFTGVFAFLTASYFVRTLFHQYDPEAHALTVSTSGLFVSYLIGILFSAGIIIIDREIVSAGSRLSALIRLPLAIIIGLVVSIPLKVLLFSDQINKELTLSAQVENADHIDRRNDRIFNAENRMNDLRERIDEERKKQAHWRNVMEAEVVGRVGQGRTGLAGEGPAYNNAKENFELHKRFEQKYVDELNNLGDEYDVIVERAEGELERMRIDQSYDFVSQYQKMQQMSRENNDLKMLGNLILILFVLIECIPAIIKLMKEPDEYDTMLQLRTRINRQLSIAAANHVMAKIASNGISIHQLTNGKYSSAKLINDLSINMSGKADASD
jgi:hypothetical protein